MPTYHISVHEHASRRLLESVAIDAADAYHAEQRKREAVAELDLTYPPETHSIDVRRFADPMGMALTLTAEELRLVIAQEREAGRAFGTLAEVCRDQIARRTGSAAA